MATLQNENHHIHPLPTKISMFCFLSFHGGFQISNKICLSHPKCFILCSISTASCHTFLSLKKIKKKKNQTYNILKLVEEEHTIKHIWVGNFLQPTIWIKILPVWVGETKDLYFQIYTL